MDKIRTFLSGLPTAAPAAAAPADNSKYAHWEQGYELIVKEDAPVENRICQFSRGTLLGAFLPCIDKIVLLFTEPMLCEAEEHYRRAIIEFITLPEISRYLGKRNCNKLATYLETGKGAPDMEIICKLHEFMLDRSVTVFQEAPVSEEAVEGRITIEKAGGLWTTRSYACKN